MGVVFDDLVYAKNNNISKGFIYLKNLNYSFNCGEVYGLIGDAAIIVGKLLVLDKRPSKGSIGVNGVNVSKTAKIKNIDDIKGNLKFVDFNEKNVFIERDFLSELRHHVKSGEEVLRKRAVQALNMVGLDESYMDVNLFDLSSTLYKKVLLAVTLCSNPKVLVLNDFDKGMCDKDKIFYKRLFVKLKTRYNKMIVIISTDIKFMIDLVDNYLVFDEGSVVLSGSKELLYNDKLYLYINKPAIIDFIMYINKLGIDMLEYTDVKELLKGIYRNLENKK